VCKSSFTNRCIYRRQIHRAVPFPRVRVTAGSRSLRSSLPHPSHHRRRRVTWTLQRRLRCPHQATHCSGCRTHRWHRGWPLVLPAPEHLYSWSYNPRHRHRRRRGGDHNFHATQTSHHRHRRQRLCDRTWSRCDTSAARRSCKRRWKGQCFRDSAYDLGFTPRSLPSCPTMV
jgi:hypothetical protein